MVDGRMFEADSIPGAALCSVPAASRDISACGSADGGNNPLAVRPRSNLSAESLAEQIERTAAREEEIGASREYGDWRVAAAWDAGVPLTGEL